MGHHKMTDKRMDVTINITRGASGLFFAKSRDVPTFLASHSNEDMLRDALPLMVKCWAEEAGYEHVTIRVLPPRESVRADRANEAAVRLRVEFNRPELVS